MTQLSHLALETPPSFERLCQTVLKLDDWFRPAGDRPHLPQTSLVAMQQLVEMMRRLRSAAPPEHQLLNQASTPFFTPENLLPYVTEEAYEVLDALEQLEEIFSPLPPFSLSPFPPSPPPFPPYSPLSPLLPYLLWSVARSSYRAMQLLEGVSRQQRINQRWQAGILRLVVLLEQRTAADTRCFDLATGNLTPSLLNESLHLHLDEPVLQPAISLDPATQNGLPEPHHPHPEAVQAQLHQLLHQIRTETPALEPFLDGISVEFLEPGHPWQTGTFQLKLGMEWVDQREDAIAPSPMSLFPHHSLSACSDLVEAELLETPASLPHPASRARNSALNRVSIVALPRQVLGAATLIRLTEQTTQKAAVQMIPNHHLETALSRLQRFPAEPADDRLVQVVREAHLLLGQTDAAIDASISLCQPQLLMDELTPKLLWHITRSSYEMAQLLGGISLQVLQPTHHWKQMTLRLFAGLQIAANGVRCTIDLASRRPLTAEIPFLHPKALCQGYPSLAADSFPVADTLGQPIFQAKGLSTRLLQQIRQASPEIGRLLDGTEIEWMEENRDWQPGILHLMLGLTVEPAHPEG